MLRVCKVCEGLSDKDGHRDEQKRKGTAVIFVGEDLDVLLELCDRIMVINGGKITGIVDARTATKEEVGQLMTKSSSMNSEEG